MNENSFKNWLYERLISDDVIAEEDYDAEDITPETIVTEMEIDDDEIETYANMYAQACARDNIEPDWEDFEEYAV